MPKGAFDPKIRPLVDIWGFERENKKVPDKSEIEKTMELNRLLKMH